MDADLYDQLRRVEDHHWWFKARRLIVCSLIERYLGGRRDLRICDIGCGTGGNLAALMDRHDVLGIEKSDEGVEMARRRLGDRVRSGYLPDGIDLPEDSFDVVLMTDVLEHIENDELSAKIAIRLLRPGGCVIATVPAIPWLYSQYDVRLHHYRRYSKGQFERLWDGAESEVLLLNYYNWILFPLAAAVRIVNRFIPTRDATNDLEVPPPFINQALFSIMRLESPLLGRVSLPIGLSLIAVIRRNRGEDGGENG